MLTLRGAALLVVAVVLWAVGRLLGVAEMYVLSVAAFTLVLAAALAVRTSSATIAARRSLSTPRLLPGSSAEVQLQLRNDARLPASLLMVEDRCHYALAESPPRFVVPGLRPGRAILLCYSVTGANRGRYTIGPVTLRVRDPFGLVERVRRYTTTDEAIVYPQVEPLPANVARGAHRGSGTSAERRLFNTGDEFYTMREYVTGDDLRQVHWPSTAHRRKLMVRQQEMPWQVQATILLDTRSTRHSGHGQDSTLEKAVSVAASLIWHLADRRYDLQLVTADQERVPPVQPWSTHLDRLAEVEGSPDRPLAPLLGKLRGGAEGLLAVVLSAPTRNGDSLAGDQDVRALLRAGRGRSGRLCVIVDVQRDRPLRSPAAQLASLLNSAGWRAVVLTPDQRLADQLDALPQRRRRPAPTATPAVTGRAG